MKKLIFAVGCALLLATAAFADESIDGVWGLKFGASVQEANSIMTGPNRAQLISQYTYQPNYSEAIYRVNFFGREGHMLLRFSKKGLFLARFAFIRKDALKSERPQPQQPQPHSNIVDARRQPGPGAQAPAPNPADRSRNYVQLNSMLMRKYGVPKEEYKESFGDGEAVIGCRWVDPNYSRCSITLYETRSLSRSDTALTYEDAGRR